MTRLTNLRPRIAAASLGKVRTLTMSEHVRQRGAGYERLRLSVLREASGVCQCADCRAQGRLRPAHEVDHVLPLWAGGTDDVANLQAINRDCHRAKSAREAAARAKGDLPG